MSSPSLTRQTRREPTRGAACARVLAVLLPVILAMNGVAQADVNETRANATPGAGTEIQASDPARVTGVVRPEVTPEDVNRALASTIFFLPRETIKLLFLASGVTSGLIRDEQVVPRVGELFSPKPGDMSLFPSLLFDTRRRVSIGGQMITSGEASGTRLSAGFGGVYDLVGEARMRFNFGRAHPFVLSLEGLADTRSHLQFLGLGEEPNTDPRNRFRRGDSTHNALYSESRSRFIIGLGYRAAQNVEVLLSSSLTRSLVNDPPDHDPDALTRIFQTGTVIGGPRCNEALTDAYCPIETHIAYSELALRLDTRRSVAMPSSGFLVEGYGGLASGTGDAPTRFGRAGARAAAFLPIVRETTIVSPRLILDGLGSLANYEVPFTALVTQPDFRNLDNRVDRLSLIASIDYRWSIIRYIGARFFVDVATVAPDFKSIFRAGPRPAVGLEMDLYSASTELAQFVLSLSKEGPVAFMSIGVPSMFGDRQHRN